jgi:hypothetical protein
MDIKILSIPKNKSNLFFLDNKKYSIHKGFRTFITIHVHGFCRILSKSLALIAFIIKNGEVSPHHKIIAIIINKKNFVELSV